MTVTTWERRSMPERLMRIGEVADLVGLSLRTVRNFDAVGLVSPSRRSPGGFRLYADGDVARLRLVMDMKPLELSVDEMRDLLDVLDQLEDAGTPGDVRDRLLERLDMYATSADERCSRLRLQLRAAESFSRNLSGRLHRKVPRD